MTVNWKNIPQEIWFAIFERLPLKRQISLACTCKGLYHLSLDPLLAPGDKRAWIYLGSYVPLPSLLAQEIRILRVPPLEEKDLDLPKMKIWEIEETREFLKKEILRMSRIRQLILEEDVEDPLCVFSVSDIQEFLCHKSLEELRIPGSYLLQKIDEDKSLLHLAVETGNTRVVGSLLFQLKNYFHQEGKSLSTSMQAEINARDGSGNTPLELAIQRRDKEMMLLLIRKGGTGKEVHFSLGSQLFDEGDHLVVDHLPEEKWDSFFQSLAIGHSLLSLEFSGDFYQGLEKNQEKSRSFFFQLAETLKRRCEETSQHSLQILLVDLRECIGLSSREIRPLLGCRELEELWLPEVLVDFVDEDGQNFIHLAVLEGNIKMAVSFIAQGVSLSKKDARGDTPITLSRRLLQGAQEMALFLEQAARQKLAKIVFGKKDWEKYYGKVGKEPLLPSHILDFLESPCPIWKGKKVADTHLITLVPESVNGKPLTLDYFEELIQNPKGGGYATKYRKYPVRVKQMWGESPAPSSHWVLFTKDILPGTRWKAPRAQYQDLENLNARFVDLRGDSGEHKYGPPKVLQAVTSLVAEYVRSGNRLYSNRSSDGTGYLTDTQCAEGSSSGYHMLVGSFKATGLSVYDSGCGYIDYGLGVMREVE